MKISWVFLWICLLCTETLAQNAVKGTITCNGNTVPFVNVAVLNTKLGVSADENGVFEIKNIPSGKHKLQFSGVGYVTQKQDIQILQGKKLILQVELEENASTLNQVTVTATMKERTVSESPAPIEILSPTLFKKAATNNIYDAMSMVNGVRPQINCNVCNTGDIHINGMEGGYTMIMIDGMPIVSGLSTVYGLFGIPNNMIERVEVMKGPASTLYGSEAVGGLINVITKKTHNAPKFNFDISTTTYQENNVDLATKINFAKASSLLSANVFSFNKRFDINHDNFTDVTLQNRVSVFNKWSIERKENRIFDFAMRGILEDRFGGEMQWNKANRGGRDVYGESIYTKRFEAFGKYQLPIKGENIALQFSYNYHNQNSAYGNTPYLATQKIAFAQLLWDKKLSEKHDALMGVALRNTYYDDNTPITRDANDVSINKPSKVWLPGFFIQDEIKFNPKLNVLAGLRYDYNSAHGAIFSPRLNVKFSPNKQNVFRASYGNGYRVVNLFSEDHAAFSGSREVVILNELKPETSQNVNLNYAKFITHQAGYISLEGSVFYTYFKNKIVADYDTDDNKVIFDNLREYGVSRGAAINFEFSFINGLKLHGGATYMNVYQVKKDEQDNRVVSWQIQTPKLTGTWAATYSIAKHNISFDYTGNVYSPMRLPILENDFRPEYSPWFALHHIQISKRFKNGMQFYTGVKNLGNFIPKNPIIRPFDPFDKHIDDLNPASKYYNPNGYTFDPSYNYAPIQRIRSFVGLRWSFY